MSAFYTACPVVDRTNETFSQSVMVGGQQQAIPFTRKVLWLQRSEAQIRLVHGGRVVREGGVYCDNRYLSSFENLDPQAEADLYGVTASSTLEVVVVVSIIQDPVIELQDASLTEAQANGLAKRYDRVPSNWYQTTVRDGQMIYPTLKERKLGEETIWSSKNTPEQNAELKRTVIEKWSVEAIA